MPKPLRYYQLNLDILVRVSYSDSKCPPTYKFNLHWTTHAGPVPVTELIDTAQDRMANTTLVHQCQLLESS